MPRIPLLLALIAALIGCYGICPGCFLAGTLISTPRGDIAIENLRAGDEVYSYDQEKQEVVIGQVEELIVHDGTDYLEVELSNSVILNVTGDHPVFSQGAWITASDLQQGSELMTKSDDLKAASIEVRSVTEKQSSVKIYNLKVRRYNNSFANGVLAHFY